MTTPKTSKPKLPDVHCAGTGKPSVHQSMGPNTANWRCPVCGAYDGEVAGPTEAHKAWWRRDLVLAALPATIEELEARFHVVQLHDLRLAAQYDRSTRRWIAKPTAPPEPVPQPQPEPEPAAPASEEKPSAPAKRGPGRPPLRGEAATEIVKVRVTPTEKAALEGMAGGVSVSELVRSWIAEPPAARGGSRHDVQNLGIPRPPPPPDYVIAKPRKGVRPSLMFWWSPRHVWTLHMVPGRPLGPPLCVRRRVLEDCDLIRFETPTGDATVGKDDRVRDEDRWTTGEPKSGLLSSGGWREEGGYDLAIEVFDHVPSVEERAAWLDRHRRRQAIVRSPPSSVWVTFSSLRRGGPVVATECQAARAMDDRLCDRGDLDVMLPGYVPPKVGEMIRNRLTVDLHELAVAGVVRCGRGLDAHAVFLRKPTPEQVAAEARTIAADVAEDERVRRQAEEIGNAFRNARAQPQPPHEAPGAAAVRSFGLDPATATPGDVVASFRAKVLELHPDRGGAGGDLAELQKRREAAEAYLANRGK